MEEEVWKDIPGSPGYRASSLGKIQGKSGRMLYNDLNKDGYYYSHIHIDGKRIHCAIHRLVAFAFLPPPENLKYVVDHINRNAIDNRASNLRWISRSQNAFNTNHTKSNMFDVKWLGFNKTLKHWVGTFRFEGVKYAKASVNKDIVIEWLQAKRKELGLPEN
jgi:hypothetical protein